MGMLRAGLEAEEYDREYDTPELIRRIGHYFAPWRKRLVTVIGAVSLLSIIGAVSPILVSTGVGMLDSLRVGGDAAVEQLVVLLVAAVLLLGVGQWAVNWLQRRLTAMLVADVVLAMRVDAFAAAMNHDLSFYDKYQSGRIVSRITSDTDEFGRVSTLITELVSQLLLVVILLVVLFNINVRLAFLVLILAPVAYWIATSFREVARRVTRQSQRVIAEVNTSIQEAVTGISVTKNFRREQSVYDDFLGVNAQSYQINVQKGLVLSMLFPTLNFFSGLGVAILLYYGGRSVTTSVIGAGSWYLFMSSVDRFWFPMINLAAFWSQFQAGLSATERIFALIDATPNVRQTDHLPVTRLRGEIEFDQVGFRYSGEKEWVLEEFSLHIRAGESIALVGHTGAGKSSIAKLVTRFYEFQEGDVRIDGQDIRSLDLESYRRNLGIVSQVPFLFSGTVADNIRYATPDLSDTDLARIASQIGRGDWLETLPDGLQTDVGERGARLSMGQRQLVVLSRMLAQNPGIFVLDEATASIDPFTEAQIQSALDLLLHGRTSIVIAHRLSTVKAADRIIVLDQGRIIEEGNHDQLMAQGGHYAELYNTYFRHQSLEFINTRRMDVEAAVA
ncbi:MAG: ABC transporter ATP-binding protein [Caldilineaceae bacterium]|nr:ABC transporter ATP-binding protein [Caldilineaceae bacterium]MBP8109088.1 ABC transporter ATP-binding protein [Caldilineaceae bacterium]MBP8124164.1 ABC transporter ATP-binding protein [Caldilineaceae bacterium]MBP9073320.1 ABC transporter ATP-binding protein [Caldilineaceae bacterium]